MRRVARTLLVALVATIMVNSALTSTAAAQTAGSAATAEVDFLRRLNTERASAGLAPLVRDSGLDGVARAWSAQMARENRLYHRPDLGPAVQAVEPRWQRAGENVGYGGSVDSLHRAFMNSPGHRANVLGDYNRVGVGVVVNGSTIWVTFNFLKGPAIAGITGLESARAPRGDFWLTTADGDVFAFGAAQHFGSMAGIPLQKPVVGMAPTPTGQGYWLVASDGGIFAFGDARFLGSTGGMRLNQPIVGMAPTPTGQGYWLVASDGGIFAFGDAAFYGSTGGLALPAPINGMAATPTGRGYWLVGAAGAVYPFGDARSFGSADAGGVPLTRIATLPDGSGYRMAAADGRVFSLGASGIEVSDPLPLRQPVVAMANRP